MNRAIGESGGALLVVSQFTLYADTRRGNRPSFTGAAPPAQGEELYEAFVAALRAAGLDGRDRRVRRPHARLAGQRRPGHDPARGLKAETLRTA